MECRDEDDRGEYRQKENEKGINLFPNPVKDLLEVSLTIPDNLIGQSVNLEIYSLIGERQILINQKMIFSSYAEKIDVSSLSSGGYLMKIEWEGNTLFSKLF